MEYGLKVNARKFCGYTINGITLPPMIYEYQGHYDYDNEIVKGWKSSAMGIYYCGYPTNNGLYPLYVGKATSSDGIRGRLLQHLQESKWPDVSHFGYRVCSTSKEADELEAAEILRLKPKYNIQGKYYGL